MPELIPLGEYPARRPLRVARARREPLVLEEARVALAVPPVRHRLDRRCPPVLAYPEGARADSVNATALLLVSWHVDPTRSVVVQ